MNLAAIYNLLVPGRCVSCRRFGSSFCAVCAAAACTQLQTGVIMREILLDTAVSLRVYAATTYSGCVRHAVAALKHADQPGLARILGKALRAFLTVVLRQLASAQIVADFDRGGDFVFVPIPSQKKRVRQRGYKHLWLLARAAGVARANICEVLVGTGKRASQQGLGRSARLTNAQALRVCTRRLQRLRGRQVVLFDDVCTTGASFAAAYQLLQRYGVRPVAAITVCSVQFHSSFADFNSAHAAIRSNIVGKTGTAAQPGQTRLA